MSPKMTYEEQATVIREIIDRNNETGINNIVDALITYIVETCRLAQDNPMLKANLMIKDNLEALEL